jgi:hypothetical protein
MLNQWCALQAKQCLKTENKNMFLEIGSLLPGLLANKLLSFAVISDKARSTVFLPEQAWPCKTECP